MSSQGSQQFAGPGLTRPKEPGEARRAEIRRALVLPAIALGLFASVVACVVVGLIMGAVDPRAQEPAHAMKQNAIAFPLFGALVYVPMVLIGAGVLSIVPTYGQTVSAVWRRVAATLLLMALLGLMPTALLVQWWSLGIAFGSAVLSYLLLRVVSGGRARAAFAAPGAGASH